MQKSDVSIATRKDTQQSCAQKRRRSKSDEMEIDQEALEEIEETEIEDLGAQTEEEEVEAREKGVRHVTVTMRGAEKDPEARLDTNLEMEETRKEISQETEIEAL